MGGAQELLDLAVRAAADAAELLVAGRARGLATVRTKSTSTDMVSEMDHAAEERIRAVLLGARPDDGFLGEETGEHAGTSGLRWVVDPLDGTTNYLYDHPGWNVSIAAEDDTGAVVAVVDVPLLADLYTATRGGGAFRNGVPITCSAVTELGTALCGTGFSYDPERRRRQAAVLAEVLPQVRDVRRMGAAAADLCSVASGRLDAYWERGLGPWDLAAGALVAAEAGARVSAEGGFVLAAAPAIFSTLHAVLVDSGAGQA